MLGMFLPGPMELIVILGVLVVIAAIVAVVANVRKK